VTANPTVTTTYTINGSNGPGCSGTTTVTVTVNPLPEVTAASATVCTGDSAVLTASGAATYTWTPATGLSATTGSSVVANPSVTTTYYITGTDAQGCSSIDTDVVTVVPSPNKPSFTQHNDTLVSSSKYDNQWYLNGTLLSSDTSQVLIITTTGDYWVIVNNEVNGCSTASDSMTITSLTGINQLTVENGQVTVYPNPTSNQLTVESGQGTINSIELTNVLGQSLLKVPGIYYDKIGGGFRGEIDLSGFPNGMYFITVVTNTARTIVKVVKQN
jgi:hypothetical protein